RLQISLVLDQLLGPAVQEPDMRIDALDHLAVEVQDETQHAVCRRVLGPEIHGEIAQISFSHGTQSECGVMRRICATRYSLTFPVSRLLVPRQRIARTLPRRQEIEVAEFLRQPDRLVDDALLLVVVAHLDETGEGKILAQRMTLEPVVR